MKYQLYFRPLNEPKAHWIKTDKTGTFDKLMQYCLKFTNPVSRDYYLDFTFKEIGV